MARIRMLVLFVLLLICYWPAVWQLSSASAHPGGLDAQGCHTNKKTGEYHCHRNIPTVSDPEPVTRMKRKTTSGIREHIETTYLTDAETRRRVDELVAKMTIQQDLIALRKKRGLTQKQLAERMGVSQPTIAAMESESARNI